ncbi:MAG: hypothetical protein ACRD6W_14995 [Nitrososphaerales archaeon]
MGNAAPSIVDHGKTPLLVFDAPQAALMSMVANTPKAANVRKPLGIQRTPHIMALDGGRGCVNVDTTEPLFRRLLVPVVALIPIVTSACLTAPSSTSVVYPGDGPDPAWAYISGLSSAEVYTTNSPTQHIPSYRSAIPPTNQSPSTFDALPTIPSQSYGNIWAPGVRGIQFNPSTSGVMMFFAEAISNRADCIGAAKSSNGLNFTPINTWTFCSPAQYTGFLDPSLFIDSSGRVWLIYSQQWAPNGGSEIDAVQIDAYGIYDGSEYCPFPIGDCGIVGEVGGQWSAYKLVGYGDVSNVNGNPGSSSFIENPSMTPDDYNGFDLTFSLGTWTSNSTYVTGEVPCSNPYGACIPKCDGKIISGGGGASVVDDSSPNGNYMIYHTWSGSNREDLAGATGEVNLDNSSCAEGLSAENLPPPQIAEQIHPVTAPYHWPPRVVIPALKDVVIGEVTPSSEYPNPPSTSTTPTPAPVTPIAIPATQPG